MTQNGGVTVLRDAGGTVRRVVLYPCHRCGATEWELQPDRQALRCRKCGRRRSAPREMRTS